MFANDWPAVLLRRAQFDTVDRQRSARSEFPMDPEILSRLSRLRFLGLVDRTAQVLGDLPHTRRSDPLDRTGVGDGCEQIRRERDFPRVGEVPGNPGKVILDDGQCPEVNRDHVESQLPHTLYTHGRLDLALIYEPNELFGGTVKRFHRLGELELVRFRDGLRVG